jgi:signal peptidase I
VSEQRRLPRWLWPVGLAGALAGGGMLLAETGPTYKNFRIPSGSMEPTLRSGEQFIARTSDFLPIERGGVYIVRKRGVNFVFRVVGLPGDEIEIIGGGVFLKDKAAYYSDDGTKGLTGTCPKDRPVIRREHLPGGASHAIMACNFSFGQDMPAMKIPAGHYFLLGDNRSNAADSRFNRPDLGLGLVPEADFVGRAERIFVSGDTSRIGQEID